MWDWILRITDYIGWTAPSEENHIVREPESGVKLIALISVNKFNAWMASWNENRNGEVVMALFKARQPGRHAVSNCIHSLTWRTCLKVADQFVAKGWIPMSGPDIKFVSGSFWDRNFGMHPWDDQQDQIRELIAGASADAEVCKNDTVEARNGKYNRNDNWSGSSDEGIEGIEDIEGIDA